MLSSVRNLTDGPIECRLIRLRRLRRPRYLAHILQRCIMHLGFSRRRLKIVQWSNVPTHRSIVHDVKEDPSISQGPSQPRETRVGGALRGSSGADRVHARSVTKSDGDGGSPSVGCRRAADRRSDERTRFSFAKSDDGSSFPAPMREETDQKISARGLRGRTRTAALSTSQNRTRNQ